MKSLIVPLLAVSALFAQAQTPPKKQQQHAHDHGAAKLNFGVEGNGGTVEFESAAEPVVGFEYKPRTAADQKKLETALTTLKARFSELVLIPAAYGCKFTSGKAEYSIHGSHGEVHAEFQLQCAKPLKGAEIRFGVTKAYPAIEEIQVQAVSEGGQTGATIRKDEGSVRIE